VRGTTPYFDYVKFQVEFITPVPPQEYLLMNHRGTEITEEEIGGDR